MKIEPLLVYMNKLGEVIVLTVDDAVLFDDIEFRHIASIDPKSYLQTILNKNAKLVADLYRK